MEVLTTINKFKQINLSINFKQSGGNCVVCFSC